MSRPIIIGWSNHQLLWIEAALTLPRELRREAFEDIATMSCRKIGAVRQRACRFARERNISSPPGPYSRERLLKAAKDLREARI